MLRRKWLAILAGLCVHSFPAASQADVSCPTYLASRFNHYQGVTFSGQEFETRWQNTAGGPLGGPSYAWFIAYPDPDPVSTDGKYRWRNAAILVHCFATLGWGGSRTYHYHPVAYSGTLTVAQIACGDTGGPIDGGEYVTSDSMALDVEDMSNPLTRLQRDPDRAGAPPPDMYLMDCDGSGGGGTGPVVDVSCHWEYLTIEISYDGGKTWSVWWEGWGQVCEEEMT